MSRVLTSEQIAELQSGDGFYYVTQGMAGHAGEWPDVVKHPKSKMLRLVKRQVKSLAASEPAHCY